MHKVFHIGVEVEFDTTRESLDNRFEIKVMKDRQAFYLSPNAYLKKFENPHLSSMYGGLVFTAQEIAEGRLKPACIDCSFDSAVTVEGEAQFLPEFRTSPFLLQDLNLLKDFVKIIAFFIAYVRISKETYIEIPKWRMRLKQYQEDTPNWLSKNYQFKTGFLKPKIKGIASVVLKSSMPQEFNPTLAIHLNVEMSLSLLYSKKILETFPIEPHYPSKKTIALEWPSCDIPPEYLTFGMELISNIEEEVERYLEEKKLSASEQEKANIAGVLRTLVYCYSMESYIKSALCQSHFPPTKYTHEYPKDFYLFGLPKFDLGRLVTRLTENEQAILTKILETPDSLVALFRKFLSSYEDLSSSQAIVFYNKEQRKNIPYSLDEFITTVLTKPLLEKKTESLCIISKVYDEILVEFRAAKGNGCTVEKLFPVLNWHVAQAKALNRSARIIPKVKRVRLAEDDLEQAALMLAGLSEHSFQSTAQQAPCEENPPKRRRSRRAPALTPSSSFAPVAPASPSPAPAPSEPILWVVYSYMYVIPYPMFNPAMYAMPNPMLNPVMYAMLNPMGNPTIYPTEPAVIEPVITEILNPASASAPVFQDSQVAENQPLTVDFAGFEPETQSSIARALDSAPISASVSKPAVIEISDSESESELQEVMAPTLSTVSAPQLRRASHLFFSSQKDKGRTQANYTVIESSSPGG